MARDKLFDLKTMLTYTAFCIGIFLSSVSNAQGLDKTLINQLKSVYNNIRQPVEPAGKRISFLNTDSLFSATGVEIVQVMIIRHQKVNIPKQHNYTYREANRYFNAYDTAGIIPVPFSPVTLHQHEVDKVYCSLLPRTINTAQHLFGNDMKLEQHVFFNEFKKDMAPLPVVKFNLGTWSVLSSVQWMLGAGNQQGETYREARARARYGAEFLESRAMQENKVVLVSHGFLNHFIRKYMKDNGWHLIVKGGHHNLGVSLLVKEKSR